MEKRCEMRKTPDSRGGVDSQWEEPPAAVSPDPIGGK